MVDDLELDELLKAEGPNGPEVVEGHKTGPTERVSNRTAAERRVFLGRALAANHTSDEIYVAMAERYNLDQEAVDKLELEIYAIWQREDTKRAEVFKGASRRRIHEYLRKMVKDKRWPSVIAAERLLADIEGTKAPLEARVTGTVTHQGAIGHLLGQMDHAEIRRLAESDDDEDAPIDVTPVLPESTNDSS